VVSVAPNVPRNRPQATARVALYVRVSSEEQRDRETVQNQRNIAEPYFRAHDITDWVEYCDEAVSGTIAVSQRPNGARLLADSAAGRISLVYITRTDRLGRDARHILNAVSELEAHGLRVKSMTEPFDTSTSSGRFMLTMLAGFAGYERDSLVERSAAGTARLAREGAWLGGVVPYGYRVAGKGREGRLVPADDAVPGFSLSEADIVRLMYRLVAEESVSCVEVARRLNAMHVPSAYARDGRQILRGKRKEATAGIWRPSRVRNLLVNSTYRGWHEYGRRGKQNREPIGRPVPALVDDALWHKAQAALRRNQLFSQRNTRRQYLLRGLIKCGTCGLTYIGVPDGRPNSPSHWYRCNGKQRARGFFGDQRCPSKAIASQVEESIWADIEHFLRDPGAVLEELAAQQSAQAENGDALAVELAAVERARAVKTAGRDLMLDLYRGGRIDRATLDRQFDNIAAEESQLDAHMARLRARLDQHTTAFAQLRSAEEWLKLLHARLAEPLTWERRRQLVEALVESIRVDTEEINGRPRPRVRVTYCFGEPIVTRTDRDSSPPPASPWRGT
jgi:site-specific DNA recombinase